MQGIKNGAKKTFTAGDRFMFFRFFEIFEIFCLLVFGSLRVLDIDIFFCKQTGVSVCIRISVFYLSNICGIDDAISSTLYNAQCAVHSAQSTE